jgi:hypothetical protein
MVVVLIVAVGLGWFVYRAHVQRDAVAAIQRAGGHVTYGSRVEALLSQPDRDVRWGWLRWLSTTLGEEYVLDVSAVTLADSSDVDAVMPQIAQLNFLRALRISGHLTNQGMAYLRHMKSLDSLNIASPDVTGLGLSYLEPLSHLTSVELQGSQLTDTDIERLKDLPRLRSLTVSSQKLTGFCFARPDRFEAMRLLSIASAQFTDNSLAYLKPLTRMTILDLSKTTVTGAGLPQLRDLPNLRLIFLHRGQANDEAIRSLSLVHPGLLVQIL